MSPLFGRRRQNSTDSSAGHPESPAVGADAAASVELRRPRWVVVIPVKRSTQGKSRLDVPGAERAELARAIALDTIEAAARCELVLQVVVVSDDPALAREAAMIPALRFVPEGEPRGLDAAVATGMTAIDPAGRMPRAALLGDLPALRPADLADALRAAASVDRAVVADAEGTGSTLVTAAPGTAWTSAFGDGSFARHVALGCHALAVTDASTLRRDVDTADQLEAARALGLGPRTAALFT
ncbi:2-phospho-L-lactate guanylyltransferase [Microbacterium sp. M3]|uniref:Phosphoenolpyruvate guanylyltransferase n=1 Tax=Microbacterium arthrosphaerae TaxID=792652 RepID=A0ABU4H0E0_9MICO|nr:MULTISPECIES: 2-phospho-L-lactate guanylyltransferase [Microbacterium]MDW4572174.1 2-phospho-L-lactate guanylyltransferase [Microbacterium arthrosphaerae]MDW7606029.1 2-phospho-L-lactate guanylyltransferase [Microbacterium sp. M3]